MTLCQAPSKLPDNLPDLPVSDANKSVLRAHFEDAQALRECARWHKTLVDWINTE
jgi:hypothetical protein